MLLPRKYLVTVDIFYYRLDYKNIVQEFVWQAEDTVPEYPRIQKFLWHWKTNINAPVKEILVMSSPLMISSYRNIDEFLDLH